MNQWAGVGQRIRELLLQAGFAKDGKPDIMRFCDERRYRHTYVFRWAKDESTPDKANLERLASDLGVTPEYLLFGPVIYERNVKPLAPMNGRRVRPTIGGPAASRPLPVESPSVTPAQPLRPVVARPRKRPSDSGRYVTFLGTLPFAA